MDCFLNRVTCFISYLKKKFIYFSCIILIVGCVPTANSSLHTAVSVVSGSETIIISSPTAFCVDQKLANKTSSSITLFIIDCTKVMGSSGETVRRRPLSAILTATLIDYGGLDVNNIYELKEILTKKPGINFLSKSNTTAMLKVHGVELDENLLLFLIEQRSPNIGVKQSDYFWRCFFFIKGKLVVITASNFSSDKSSQQRLKKLLLEFVDMTIAANNI